MNATFRTWPLSAILLALASAIIIGIGVYFIAFRPTFLPEDVSYMQLTATELSAMESRLAPWLARVYRVLGGYAAATGLLGVTLAATSFRKRHPVAFLGALSGGIASIGLMAAVNVAIDSQFKLPLLVLAVLWFASVITFVLEGVGSRKSSPNSQGMSR